MRADPVRSRNSHQKTQTDGRNAQRAVRSHSHIGLSEPKRELLYSPGVMVGAVPTTVTRSRWPRTFTRSTQKPVSSLWKVTRSTAPVRCSVGWVLEEVCVEDSID